MLRLNPRTSPPDRSIWDPLPEPIFRTHLVALEHRTNAVPLSPQVFPLAAPHPTTTSTASTHTLPLPVEHRLASDLAFLAALSEGAQSVAAACLEEHTSPHRHLVVRFAALDLSLSADVKAALQAIVATLRLSAHPRPSTAARTEHLFAQIVDLHSKRLLARLRSAKWEKPTYLRQQHKKPLWRDFENLAHRVQFLYAKREAGLRGAVESAVRRVARVFEAFEGTPGGSREERAALRDVVRESYAFCTDEGVRGYAARLEGSVRGTPTRQVASAVKTFRQVEKIGAYWRIAGGLVRTSEAYPGVFGHEVRIAFLAPYEGVRTEVGYEAWAGSCHVHAEVQLAVYYDLKAQRGEGAGEEGEVPTPRVIGTSKWLCYLCYLFLRAHGGFVVANTHGRLYDQWTVPDLEEFGEHTCARYRDIIRAIDEEVIRETGSEEETEGEASVRWRAEPMTSRQNLLLDDEEILPVEMEADATTHASNGADDISAKLKSVDLQE